MQNRSKNIGCQKKKRPLGLDLGHCLGLDRLKKYLLIYFVKNNNLRVFAVQEISSGAEWEFTTQHVTGHN